MTGCYRCGLEFTPEELRTFPTEATVDQSRIYVCAGCAGGEDVKDPDA